MSKGKYKGLETVTAYLFKQIGEKSIDELEDTYFFCEEEEEPHRFLHHLSLAVYETRYNMLTKFMREDFIRYAERWDRGEFRSDVLPNDIFFIQSDIDYVRRMLTLENDESKNNGGDNKMKEIIGFCAEDYNSSSTDTDRAICDREIRRSVVQVYFEYKDLSLTYFNDCFDIRVGDGVYVDGKLSGHLGVVTCVNYNFKIDVNRYQRIISVVDTHVSGTLQIMDSYLIAFEPYVIPAEKIFPWYFEPVDDRNVWMECGYDDRRITLYDLSGLNADRAEIDKGLYMYESNAVRYLSYVNGAVRAIVRDNTRLYTVECEYRDGDIMKLTCDCYNAFDCKHEIAVLTLLREVLDKYGVGEKGYFAVINKQDFFEKANVSSQTGTINIE